MGPKKIGKKGKKKGDEVALSELAEEETDPLVELQKKEAELQLREKNLLQKQKELQIEAKKLHAHEEDLKAKAADLAEIEADLKGREESVRQWSRERDEEWAAQLAGQYELLTKKERHAILIGVNKYNDSRIRSTTHSVIRVHEIGRILEQLNFKCTYLHDDLPDAFLPTRQNIVKYITELRRDDVVLVVYFCGHVVYGHLTPPRSSPIMRFILPCNTPLEFAMDAIITTDELMDIMTRDCIDVNDNVFTRKGIILVDGSYIGVTYGSKSEGYVYVKCTNGAELVAEYKKSQHNLLTCSLQKALQGAVEYNGLIPVDVLIEYLHSKLIKHGVSPESISNVAGDPSKAFPIANKLLKSKKERLQVKDEKKSKKCTFTLTFTVNQDLDVHSTILQRIVSNRLIDYCGDGVELGKMELVGVTEIILEGVIQYAVKIEKRRLWQDAVAQFTQVNDIPFSLVSGESTRQGDEGRSAVVVRIETENESTINTMRNNFTKMKYFFGHPCIDLRQHIRVSIVSTDAQFESFQKVAVRGQLDDAIFTFTGLFKHIHNVERFNNVHPERMLKLVSDGLPLLIVSTKSEPGKRNEALGRVADLEHFKGKFRFFFNDVLVDGTVTDVSSLPGPTIAPHLASNTVILCDVKQGRNYTLAPGKSFFVYGFFPDSDIRELCDAFLEGQLEVLNHRLPMGNVHPKYRLL